MKKPIALIGARCVGKTTVGRRLAELLELPFTDLDDALARQWAAAEGATSAPHAGELLTRLGEPGFRALECAVLLGLSTADGVVATGGGVVVTAAARAALAGSFHNVWLTADVVLLQERLRADATPRPALTAVGDPVAELPDLVEVRAPLYAEVADARIEVDGLTVDEVARAVLAVCRP